MAPTGSLQRRVRVHLARHGDIIRGAFVINAHDREIIAWRAVVNARISGSDMRDVLVEAVERRFGTYRAPSVIEMLSDNGSALHREGSADLRPPAGPEAPLHAGQRPQSIGISEAFVKTLKRDYVQMTPLPDAQTVLGLIEGWIEDYNDNHPHSGLKMRRQREFIAAQTATARVSGETGPRAMSRSSTVPLAR